MDAFIRDAEGGNANLTRLTVLKKWFVWVEQLQAKTAAELNELLSTIFGRAFKGEL